MEVELLTHTRRTESHCIADLNQHTLTDKKKRERRTHSADAHTQFIPELCFHKYVILPLTADE